MRTTWAIALLLLPASLAGDEVVLRSGGRLTGVVVEDSPTRVVLETGPGRVTIPRARILRVVSSASSLERFQARAAQAGNDARAWLALGEWAAAEGLQTQASQAFERVLRLDPGNAVAHAALGHVQVAGRWLVEDEAYAARGYVRFDGRWMQPAERDALLAERQAEMAERTARLEAEARVREAEARARAAEADARAAETAARPAAEGIPMYPPVIGGYGPYVGGYGGYGGYGVPVVTPPPPPVVVVVKPTPASRSRQDPGSRKPRPGSHHGDDRHRHPQP